MNKQKKGKALIMGLALAAVGLWSGRAQANFASTMTIDIAITASKSVSIVTSGVNTSTVTPLSAWSSVSTCVVSATSSTIINDSGGIAESWALMTFAASGVGGAGWSLATTTGSMAVDTFALQAVFVSSNTPGLPTAVVCPGVNASTWTISGTRDTIVTGLNKTYDGTLTTGHFVGVVDALGNDGSGLAVPDGGITSSTMYANYTDPSKGKYGQRGLCWRVVGPPYTTSPATNQKINLLITAQ